MRALLRGFSAGFLVVGLVSIAAIGKENPLHVIMFFSASIAFSLGAKELPTFVS